MTREEMRERVARALAETQGEIVNDAWRFYLDDADAAIAIIRGETLGEAAKVAVTPCPVVPHPRECQRCANSKLKYKSPRDAAAAIRALKETRDE